MLEVGSNVSNTMGEKLQYKQQWQLSSQSVSIGRGFYYRLCNTLYTLQALCFLGQKIKFVVHNALAGRECFCNMLPEVVHGTIAATFALRNFFRGPDPPLQGLPDTC